MPYRFFLLIAFQLLFRLPNVIAVEAPITTYETIQETATTKILSPAVADRQTKKVKLRNGLQIYLISDPHVDQSGAALSVNVGSWMDPVEFPGLAHFLEHMLFLGTAKYPDESSFEAFITEHGGMTNAFTTDDFTSFMFSVDNAAFEESLDRFSSFFKEPLFNPSGVMRELHAIDQEYAKNVENDDIRLITILKALANKEHPYSRFSMGNSETLGKVSRETFIDWYEKHYSANLMRLTLQSNLPLDELQELAIKDFQDIPDRQVTLTPIDKPLISNETKGKIIYIAPIKNVQKLVLVWDLPLALADVKEDQAPSIVCQTLGHEENNSILGALKSANLAESLGCGTANIGGRNQQLYMEIGLTALGIKKIDTVIGKVFQSIDEIRKQGIPSYIFDEVQQLARINYQYQSAQDAFQTMTIHAGNMMTGDFSGYPEKNQIPQKYNPKAIADVLNHLTVDNAIIAVIAPTALTGVPTNMKEKWLGVQYALWPEPADWIAAWKADKQEGDFFLPLKNPFIPKNLSIFAQPLGVDSIVSIIPKPTKILDDDRATIYYCSDKQFRLPYLSLLLTIKTPYVDVGVASKTVLADLYISLLKEALIPLIYPATTAGLEIGITRENFGIGINIQGYSDKASLLVEKVIEQIKAFSPKEEKFKIYKESLSRDYQNAAMASPLEQALETLKAALYKKYAQPKALANAIKKISFESFSDYANEIFKKAHIEGMFYGNLTEQQAKEFANDYVSTLKAQPYPKKSQKIQEVITFPDNKGPFYLESNSKVQGNAIILAIANGPYSFDKRAVQQILMEAIAEPFFATLRTQQQTGYIVDSNAYELEKHLFCLFLTQSSSYDPRDLLSRFELFIESFLRKGNEAITQQNFENIQKAFIAKLKKPAKNMSEMAKLLNLIAFTYDGDFDWMEKRVEAFTQLTYEAFLPQCKELLGRENRKQLAILFKGAAGSGQTFNFTRLSNITELHKLSKK